MSNKKAYLPKVRTDYYPTEDEIRSYAPNGDSTPLPNPAVDDIVVNNIAWQEFDYTDSVFDEGDDILSDSDYSKELNFASKNVLNKGKFE